MNNADKVRCRDCSAEVCFRDTIDINGLPVCEDCQENYERCYHCADWRHRDDLFEVDGRCYCRACVDAYFGRCTCCEKFYRLDQEVAWGGMCPSCGEEHFECRACNEIYPNDDYGDDGLCNECSRASNEEGLPDYHQGCNNIVFYPNDRCNLYFGVELETDGYEDRAQAVEDLEELSDNKQLFWYEDDSSLNNGIEIISQPCTLEYHRTTFPWATIVEAVKRYGGRSHDTRTCGLHIHFSRTFINGPGAALAQLKLVYLFEKFWEQICTFSRRCSSCNAAKYDTPIFDTTPTRRKLCSLNGYGRRQSVNLTPHHTVEIRTFRGSLSVSTILASVEFVDFLVRLAKRKSVAALQAFTWTELTEHAKQGKYKYLMPYLVGKGLAGGKGNVSNRSQTDRD